MRFSADPLLGVGYTFGKSVLHLSTPCSKIKSSHGLFKQIAFWVLKKYRPSFNFTHEVILTRQNIERVIQIIFTWQMSGNLFSGDRMFPP